MSLTPSARAGHRLPPGDKRHGTRGGYSNWGCRCQPCTKANTDAVRNYFRGRGVRPIAEWRAELRAQALASLPPHGSEARYLHKLRPCRCARCRKASAEARKRRRKKSGL